MSPERGPHPADPAARRARGRRSAACRIASAALAACAALTGCAPRAAAHDFWIEPSTFRPAAGSTVTFRLRVGESLRGEPLARDASMVLRFVAAGPGGELAVAGADGAEPAGLVALAAPGPWVVAYQSRPTAIELEAAKFESYLAAEGLERLLALRRARGEERRPARELYSRSAKTLLVVGGETESGAVFAPPPTIVGLTLELVPLTRTRDGDLEFRLLYEGRPVSDVLVAALAEGAPDVPLAARTDDEGRVTLPLAAPGTWLVKAVHMVEAAPGTGADYESFWASLTLALPAR